VTGDLTPDDHVLKLLLRWIAKPTRAVTIVSVTESEDLGHGLPPILRHRIVNLDTVLPEDAAELLAQRTAMTTVEARGFCWVCERIRSLVLGVALGLVLAADVGSITVYAIAAGIVAVVLVARYADA
jgi:hypothetical protein